jgi:lactoylglutathione lyase
VPDVKLNLLVLKTRTLDKLKDFYTAFGINFVEEKHGDGPTHFAGRVGELVLELYPLPVDAGLADDTTRLGFVVPDLDAAVVCLGGVAGDRGQRATANQMGEKGRNPRS